MFLYGVKRSADTQTHATSHLFATVSCFRKRFYSVSKKEKREKKTTYQLEDTTVALALQWQSVSCVALIVVTLSGIIGGLNRRVHPSPDLNVRQWYVSKSSPSIVHLADSTVTRWLTALTCTWIYTWEAWITLSAVWNVPTRTACGNLCKYVDLMDHGLVWFVDWIVWLMDF